MNPVIEGMNEILGEILTLRHGIAIESCVRDQGRILDTLLQVRVRVDRVEELFGRLLTARGQISRAAQHKRSEVSDAFDTALTRQRKSPVSLDADFLGAKERYAMANLEVLEARHKLRDLDEIASTADTIVEVARLNYRGLTDLRHDLLTMLRAAQFETTLDR